MGAVSFSLKHEISAIAHHDMRTHDICVNDRFMNQWIRKSLTVEDVRISLNMVHCTKY